MNSNLCPSEETICQCEDVLLRDEGADALVTPPEMEDGSVHGPKNPIFLWTSYLEVPLHSDDADGPRQAARGEEEVLGLAVVNPALVPQLLHRNGVETRLCVVRHLGPVRPLL